MPMVQPLLFASIWSSLLSSLISSCGRSLLIFTYVWGLSVLLLADLKRLKNTNVGFLLPSQPMCLSRRTFAAVFLCQIRISLISY